MTNPQPGSKLEVLHGLSCDVDRGGIVSFLRALNSAADFDSILGVNPGCRQLRSPPLATLVLPRMAGESSSPLSGLRGLRCAWQVRRWLRADRRRLFHGHSRAGIIVCVWLKLLGERRAIATVHSLGQARWTYRWAAKLLGDRIYWLGPAMKRHYGLPVDGWRQCLPDCVPSAAISGPPRLAGEARGTIVLGCGGTLVPVKQWELLLEALPLLRNRLAVTLLHAGGEDGTPESAAYARDLRALAARLGVTAQIEWLGEQDGLSAVFARTDIFVSPSSREASSMAALEAIGAGIPVIAADGSGTRDLVNQTSFGWCFSGGSAAALADTMVAAAQSIGALTRSEPGLQFFGADAVAALHRAAYRKQLAEL